MAKLQLLWNKQSSSSLNLDIIQKHFGPFLILKNETRWNSEYDAVTCIVRLLRNKSKGMKRMFVELNLIPLTPNEEQYLKEYSKIMRCFTEALDILQGTANNRLGYLLPKISELKETESVAG